MTARIPAFLALAASALLLAGCAKDAELYPSLAIRDAERISGVFDPVAPEPYTPAPPSPETLDRLAALRADAQGAHTKFLAAAESARAPVAAARNAPVGGEQWSVAQVALGGLSSAQSETMVAMAELDLIFVETQNEAGDLTAIEAARAEVQALVSQEDSTLAQMSGQLAN